MLLNVGLPGSPLMIGFAANAGPAIPVDKSKEPQSARDIVDGPRENTYV